MPQAKELKNAICSPNLKTATKEEKDRFIKILDRKIEDYEKNEKSNKNIKE